MYGSESWILNSTLLVKLESFQAELGKRILKLPKYTSNTIPLLALNWPSMCCRILCCKLAFLQCVLKNGTSHSLSFQTFNSIAASDVMSMTIVKQCKFLEEKLGSNSSFTNEVLTQSSVSIRDLNKRILSHDVVENTPTFRIPPFPSLSPYSCEPKHVDEVLGHCTGAWCEWHQICSFHSTLTVFSDRICPVDECDYILPENFPLCTHFIHTHTNLPADYTPDILTNLILSIGDYPNQFHELTSLSYSFANHFPF